MPFVFPIAMSQLLARTTRGGLIKHLDKLAILLLLLSKSESKNSVEVFNLALGGVVALSFLHLCVLQLLSKPIYILLVACVGFALRLLCVARWGNAFILAMLVPRAVGIIARRLNLFDRTLLSIDIV